MQLLWTRLLNPVLKKQRMSLGKNGKLSMARFQMSTNLMRSREKLLQIVSLQWKI